MCKLYFIFLLNIKKIMATNYMNNDNKNSFKRFNNNRKTVFHSNNNQDSMKYIVTNNFNIT